MAAERELEAWPSGQPPPSPAQQSTRHPDPATHDGQQDGSGGHRAQHAHRQDRGRRRPDVIQVLEAASPGRPGAMSPSQGARRLSSQSRRAERDEDEDDGKTSAGASTPIAGATGGGADRSLPPPASLPIHTNEESSRQSRWTRLKAVMRHRAMHTGPGWFAANMGLGIASILLYSMPWQFRGLQEIGLAFFVANVILFSFLLGMNLARYTIWPRLLPIMLYHPTQAFFLGTFTMGAVTLVEIVILALIPRLGHAWLYVGWVSWWICAACTIVVAIGVPFLTQTRQSQSFEHITGVWFLPIVAPVVCASAGSIVGNALVDAGVRAASLGDVAGATSFYSHARVQEIWCYLLLGIGLVPSLLWMPIYSTRLAIHKLPTAVIVSAFVPLGCCGQGAFAILHISRTLRRLTLITGSPPLGGGTITDTLDGAFISPTSALAMADAIYAVSQVGALFLWGLGIVWLSLAVMSIADVLSVSDISLNLGLWASTFPVGTMAASAALFGTELDSTAFKVISTVLSVIVVLDVTWIAVVTLIKGWTGELFHAPDLAEIGGEVPTALPPARKYSYQPRGRQNGAALPSQHQSSTQCDTDPMASHVLETFASTGTSLKPDAHKMNSHAGAEAELHDTHTVQQQRIREDAAQHSQSRPGAALAGSKLSSRSRSTSSNRTRINDSRRPSAGGFIPLTAPSALSRQASSSASGAQ